MIEKQDQKTIPSRAKTSPAWFILLGAVVLGLIVMMGAWMKKSDAKMLQIGQPVPDFSLTSFDGETYTLSQYRGKVVLINVWASWCYTCDEESYMLQEVWTEVEPAGETLFLGVDYVDTEKPALDFIREHGMTYPNGPDLGSAISKMLKIQGVPETFLIGTDGTLQAIQIGPFASAEDVRDFLAQATR